MFPNNRHNLIFFHLQGGISSGTCQYVEGDDQCMRIEGVIRTENWGGFVSFRRPFPSPLDVADYSGVYLTYKAPITFQLCLKDRMAVSQEVLFKYVVHSASLTDGIVTADGYRTVYLPFKQGVPEWRGQRVARPALDTKEICEISIMTTKNDAVGKFALFIREIGIYA
jgi:hypothetical protein